MFSIYRRAKEEAKYNATIFLRMLSANRGVRTAKTLINSSKPSDGYTAPYMKGRLDLTVEALVVEDQRWHTFFTEDELQRARKRLSEYQYALRG